LAKRVPTIEKGRNLIDGSLADSEDQAVDLAQRSPYGLGASIWTSDPDRATQLAPRLNVGTLWINHHMEARPDAPFGGAKASGIGCENGAKVLDEYGRFQVINQWRG
jgi:acyl-CoA reductase-like NAD-dependent aldehyde dehydrogenase